MGGQEFGAATKNGIAREQVVPTLQYISELAGIPGDALIALGSAGKKPRSGDLDIAIDARRFNQAEYSKIIGRLKVKLGAENHIYRPGFRTNSFSVPISGNTCNGRVQVDIKYDNADFLQFSHYSAEGERSKYKGAVRTFLLTSLATSLHTPGEDVELRRDGKIVVDVRWGLDVNSGLKRLFRMRRERKDGKGWKTSLESVSAKEIQATYPDLQFDGRARSITDPDKIAKHLFGKGVTAKDLETAEDVIKLIASRHAQILDSGFVARVSRHLSAMGLAVPNELTLAHKAKEAAAATPTSLLATATLPKSETAWREFRLVKGKKTREWAIAMEPDGESFRIRESLVSSGVRESEVIRPGQRGVPGKVNYQSAREACLLEVERRVLHRVSQGFGELINGELRHSKFEIDFSKPFPRNILTPKPEESVSEEEYRRLHRAGLARVTRKYDGMGLIVVRHSFGWELYSLQGLRVTEFFPKHIEALLKSDYTVGTILKAEATVFDPKNPGKDGLGLLQKTLSVLSDPSEVRSLIDSGERPEPSIVIYDILYRGGESLGSYSYDQRREHWKHFPVARGGRGLIQSAESFDVNPENWDRVRKAHGFEGFVLNDGSATLGKDVISFSSSVPRPKGCYKLKPLAEQDVVIYAVRKVDGVYESVFTKQRYPNCYPGTKVRHGHAGEWFFSGKVSTLNMKPVMEKIDEYVKAGLIQVVENDRQGFAINFNNDSGVVAVIQFFERYPSGKFRDPRFVKPVRFRNEGVDFKAVNDCVATILGVPSPGSK